MEKTEHRQAYGVFKPVGHVVVSFPPATDLDAVSRALAEVGFPPEEVRRYSAREMVEQADRDLAEATALASLGQEANLVKAHRALAEQGYGFLVVHAPKDGQAATVAEVAGRFGAERAQHYGRMLIEELIEHPDDTTQVAESAARGLDAQTPSGREQDRR
jgi:hypothetical protein